MVTLSPITHAHQLDEYFRFRAQVYRQSPVSGFLHNTFYDKDKYDDHSFHFGWYDAGLQACIRFICPAPFTESLYSFTLLPKPIRRRAVNFMQTCLKEEEPVVELSRICVRPSLRNATVLKSFSLAIISKLLELKIDNALFIAYGPHRPYWQRYGCVLLHHQSVWVCPKINAICYMMVYKKETIPHEIRVLIQERDNQKPTT